MPHLLLVEDDELLRDGLMAQLMRMGHTITVACSGDVAIHTVDSARFDGVILDLGLPMIDGMDVLVHIRRRHAALPVLVLTARDGVEDRVAGLNAGADDYLTKPFNFTELAARIASMLRRAQLPAFGGAASEMLIQGLRIHALEPRAWLTLELGEQELELTQREWSLLALLVSRTGQVVTREDVWAHWHQEGGVNEETNALEVYIHRLRKKLEGSSLQIRNVRGLGYLLDQQGTKR